MSAYLMYHPRTRPTGQGMRSLLGINGGISFSRMNTEDTLIRWGNSRDRGMDATMRRVINRAESIDVARHKLRTFNQLEAMGLLVPTFSVEVPERRMDGADTWFAREPVGSGGSDIRIVTENDEFPEATFYSKYIPSRFELRIHVVNGEVIRYQKKYLRHSDTPSMIRNVANGYVYEQPESRPNQERFDAAIKAVGILGLDFGAVDLLVDEANRSVVLEVNTAPACSPKTLGAYVEAFRKLLGSEDV